MKCGSSRLASVTNSVQWRSKRSNRRWKLIIFPRLWINFYWLHYSERIMQTLKSFEHQVIRNYWGWMSKCITLFVGCIKLMNEATMSLLFFMLMHYARKYCEWLLCAALRIFFFLLAFFFFLDYTVQECLVTLTLTSIFSVWRECMP